MIKKAIFLIFILLFVPPVSAIMTYSKVIHIDFEPNLQYDSSYEFWGADHFRCYIAGELAEYATLEDPAPGSGRRVISVHLELPEEMSKPGKWMLKVGCKESSASGGKALTAVAAMEEPLYVHVPYTGQHVSVRIDVPNAEINETLDGLLFVKSVGTETVPGGKAKLWIIDEEKEKVWTNEILIPEDIETSEGVEKKFSFSTTEWSAGYYEAWVNFTFGDKFKAGRKIFNLGDKKVSIVSYPKELFKDSINEFPIKVRANWKYPMNVKATVYINGDLEGRTTTGSISNFNEATLMAYVNTKDITLGEYDLRIHVEFGEFEANFYDKISVVIGESKVEQPSSLNLNMIILAGMASIVIMLALVVLLISMFKRK